MTTSTPTLADTHCITLMSMTVATSL